MNRRSRLILAAALGAALFVGGTGVAYALQADASASLRSSGQAGEQADGYLGLVGSAPAAVRAQVDSVNIKRRAYYTDLAAKRGAKALGIPRTEAASFIAAYYQRYQGVQRFMNATLERARTGEAVRSVLAQDDSNWRNSRYRPACGRS